VKGKEPKIKKGSQVKIQRSLLYHIAKPVQRVSMPSSEANTYNISGTIINGNSSKGWVVQFDIFPWDNNIVRYITRSKLTVLENDEEEEQYDLPTELSDYADAFKTLSQAADTSKPCTPQQEFLAMPEYDIATANILKF
jgi:hypothetical protein